MTSNDAVAPIPVGFRFHPTDEELVGYYLHGKVGRSQRDQLIQELDLYKIEPWDLHEVCRIGVDATENQSDWYFFSHKDKKYPTGNRANRATTAGFWKATGRDKPIHTQRHVIGMRKTLVFYKGRAPHGQKTDWIMHEFRLDDAPGSAVVAPANFAESADGWVVCRVFRKTKSFKTKSQDTSCSFEDNVVQHGGLLMSPSAAAVAPKLAMFGTDSAGQINLHHHHQQLINSFACKQELSINDYGHETPSFGQYITSIHDDQGSCLNDLQDQLHRSMNALAPCSSSALRALITSTNVAARSATSSVAPSLPHVESAASRLDVDESCSLAPHEISSAEPSCLMPGSLLQPGDATDFWRLASDQGSGHPRRDQTLADVTCHVGHQLKRDIVGTSSAAQPDQILSSPNHNVSNINLVHLWNNV